MIPILLSSITLLLILGSIKLCLTLLSCHTASRILSISHGHSVRLRHCGPEDTTPSLDFNKARSSLEATTQFYDSAAQNYEETIRGQGWQGPELCVAALCKAMEDRPFPQHTLHILDLGSGCGLVGLELSAKLGGKFQLEMTAFDISEKMLEKAKDRKIYTHFQSGNIMDPKVAISTAPFHVVICVGVTSYLEPHQTLSKVVDILIPGGLLVTTYKATVAPEWLAMNKRLVTEGKVEIVEHSTGNPYLPGNTSSDNECDIVVLQKS